MPQKMPSKSPRAICLWLIAAAVVALANLASAQAPEAHHSLSLDVRLTSSGGSSDSGAVRPPSSDSLHTTTATFKRERESSLALDVQVRNLASHPDTAKVEWFFFSRPVGGGEEKLYDRGTQQVEVAASSSTSLPVESEPLHNSITKSVKSSTHDNPQGGTSSSTQRSAHWSGARASGWAVRLVVPGAAPIVRASSTALQNEAASLPPVPEKGGGKKK